ncbi:MAG: sugar ABC transporter permease, partial [Pseudomonadota bacterium]
MRGKVPRKTIFAFIGPAVIGLALVGIAPLLYAVWTSLHFYNLTKLKRVEFIGLENYVTVLTDEVFWQAMGRTFFLLGTALPLQIGLGLIIALVLH